MGRLIYRWTLCVPVLPGGRLIDAVGIAAHGIAGDRISARAAAAADRLELAHAALAFELGIVTHTGEHRRRPVDVRQRPRANIAADEIQKTARLDIARVGDEDDAFAVVDAEWRAQNLSRLGVWRDLRGRP